MLNSVRAANDRCIVEPLNNFYCKVVGEGDDYRENTPEVAQILKYTVRFPLVRVLDARSTKIIGDKSLVGQINIRIREAHYLLITVHLRQALGSLIKFEQVPNVILKGDSALHEVYIFGLIHSWLDVKESTHIGLVENCFFFVLSEEVGARLEYR